MKSDSKSKLLNEDDNEEKKSETCTESEEESSHTDSESDDAEYEVEHILKYKFNFKRKQWPFKLWRVALEKQHALTMLAVAQMLMEQEY